MKDEKLAELERKLRSELSEEKLKFIDKYRLELNSRRRWICRKNQTPERVYFSHKFILNNSILEIISRKYQLCFVKLKYFRKNLDKYDFLKYDPEKGFCKTELWDAEFFRHIKSERIIDLRYLQQIRNVEVFNRLLEWLESFPERDI
jgi:hypothetical protein